MKIGKSYLCSRETQVGPTNNWEEHSSYPGPKFIDIPPNTPFLVVDGPVRSLYMSKHNDEREVVGYRVLAPNCIGWMYLWKWFDDKLSDTIPELCFDGEYWVKELDFTNEDR